VPTTVSESQPGSFDSDIDGPVWDGNFACGDALLYSGPQYGAAGGPILIDFGTHLVSGGGAQIEPNAFYVPFIAQIVAYDSRMNVLGTFTEDGYAEPANDDSAIFIGVRSTSQDIRAISVDVLTPSTFVPAHDFAINRFDFRSSTGIGISSVPEPSAVVLLGTGAYLLCGLGRSRRRSPA
jgi:hypothetical protein